MAKGQLTQEKTMFDLIRHTVRKIHSNQTYGYEAGRVNFVIGIKYNLWLMLHG